jgi:hypothetical protein
MTKITRELLAGYLEDGLNDAETATIEQELRRSEPLRRLLRTLIQENDRGEHSIGAIWRRQRLSCPTREQLGASLLGALDPEVQDYVDFHLQTIACAYCSANLADLQQKNQDSAPKAQQRRKRYFESSAGLLSLGKKRD